MICVYLKQHKPMEPPHHHSEAMSNHLKQEPPATSFVCPTCSESFISSEGLTEHKKVAHVNVGVRNPPVTYSPMPCKFSINTLHYIPNCYLHIYNRGKHVTTYLSLIYLPF